MDTNTQILTSLQLTLADIEKMAANNSGFLSMIKGYAAERMLSLMFEGNSEVTSWVKNSDRDSEQLCDFTVVYRGETFRIELKTQSCSGVVKLKTSDRKNYFTTDGVFVESWETTALPADRFDILAVCTINEGLGWGFKFFDVNDVPRAKHEAIPEALREGFLTSNFKSLTAANYTIDPFTLMDRLIGPQALAA